jgi:deazaflavin-dependent oxidoreductase (nitroreductase family)
MPKSERVLGAGAWLLETSHRTLLALTGGRFPRTILGMQTVEIHVKGRKSGKQFSNMLTTPIREKDWFVIIASKGGSQDHPDWYKNLVANPDIEATIDGERVPMHARTATGDERAELWQRVTSKYKNYAGYQVNTDREIPVVVCEPRS